MCKKTKFLVIRYSYGQPNPLAFNNLESLLSPASNNPMFERMSLAALSYEGSITAYAMIMSPINVTNGEYL